jgi:hypothetical protein
MTGLHKPRAGGSQLYVTGSWCPPADRGVQVLRSHMLTDPGPEREQELEAGT